MIKYINLKKYRKLINKNNEWIYNPLFFIEKKIYYVYI